MVDVGSYVHHQIIRSCIYFLLFLTTTCMFLQKKRPTGYARSTGTSIERLGFFEMNCDVTMLNLQS